jgi:glucose-6-phosphate isomerase
MVPLRSIAAWPSGLARRTDDDMTNSYHSDTHCSQTLEMFPVGCLPSWTLDDQLSTEVESTSVPEVEDRGMKTLESTSSWSRAIALAPPSNLSQLFSGREDRQAMLMLQVGDLTIDLTRQPVDGSILDALIGASIECDVQASLDRMMSGFRINSTENRAVGHTALRMHIDESFPVDGIDVVPLVHETLEKLSAFAVGVRRGEILGATGRRFVNVVNIGIGGSDLGPRLVSEALRSLHQERITCRFVGNVDPEDLSSNLVGLDPAETLFIVASKTFTTVETLINARSASSWISEHLGAAAVAQHVVAVSADLDAVRKSGIGAEVVFPMWDWVGGRFSVGSAVGLSAMIEIGPEAFRDMLDGMRDVDQHVRFTQPARNAPLLMALIGIWNHSVLGHSSRAVIPYAHALRRLPAYLQQLLMESNGKSVRGDGSPVGLESSAVIWGDVGTNAQHAFMQLLHQGTSVVPVDFIGFARTVTEVDSAARVAERTLFMNMVAQAQSLAFGRNESSGSTLEAGPHRTFTGNRPSTVIVAPQLTARTLGQILALYEYGVFYEGVLLGVNSFDQWGVELGKEMASELMRTSSVPNDSVSPASRAAQPLLEWFDNSSPSWPN